MTWYAVMGTQGVAWVGEAEDARAALRLHMDDIGLESYSQARVYEIPPPPAGWQQASPVSWLGDWVDAKGTFCLGIPSQLRVYGRIYDAEDVFNAMDSDIVWSMAGAGVRCKPLTAGDTRVLPLHEYLKCYMELHEDTFGAPFTFE